MIPSISVYMLHRVLKKDSLNQPLEMVAIVIFARIQKPVVIHVVHNVSIILNNLGFDLTGDYLKTSSLN